MDILAFSPILPELTLAICSLVLLLWGAFNPKSSHMAPHLGILVLLLVAAITATGVIATDGGIDAVLPAGFHTVTDFSTLTKILVLLAGALCLFISPAYLKREDIARPEYTVLVLIASLGMMLMLSASNMLMLYVGLELQSLALYVLAAFRRDSVRSSEAGLKYFVLGALASGLLLYGISLVYGFSGSLDFTVIGQTLAGPNVPAGIVIGLILILAALSFKISAAPFHMWAPDVYEGAPTTVTAFFSVAPKLAAMGLLMQVLFGPFAALKQEWAIILSLLSALSMIVGALGAIGQTNLKRLLAYSSIGHVGFALMALAAGTSLGGESVLFYLAFYIAMSIGAFCVLLLMRRDGRMLEEVSDLSGISQAHPGLADAMAIIMFSMAGIPPMVGFFTKFYVFMAAIDGGLHVLAILGAIASVIGAYYYLRVIKVMYFDEPLYTFDRPMEFSTRLTLTACTTITLFGVLLMGSFGVLAQVAIKSLIAP